MKISFISQYFHPEPFSNTAIAKELARRRHEVHVTTAVPNYPEGVFFPTYSNREKRREVWEGIQVERVRTIARGRRSLTLALNYATFALMGCLKFLLRPDRPDVIFVSQLSPVTMILPAVIQSWRTGAPIVCWVQDIWPESATDSLKINNKLVLKALHSMSGWLYRRADVILVQSPAFKGMIQRFGIDGTKIQTLPNTAPQGFEPHPAGPVDGLDQMGTDGSFRIMFAGNIGEAQDFETIVAAAEMLKEREALKWVIIGDGRYMARLKDHVKKKGLTKTFSFLGRKPEADMPAYFAHADVMLVSLKDTDIFSRTVPYKVQCYMACGAALLGSLNGEGAKTIEDAKAGLVSPSSSPEILAQRVRELMDMDETARHQLRQNARQYFLKNYAADVVYDRLENCLSEQIRK
jgi:colanic acid biosynthesis glycosyl transferase WcaI